MNTRCYILTPFNVILYMYMDTYFAFTLIIEKVSLPVYLYDLF